ncbi:hypothetical protein ACEWY4_002120 [Coilia grayii]|uniref:Uncharacterized protein n=1 Tax=Coilia grayii TaxID=363190 RepID=A0ABD1KUX0_9TELE
MEREIGEISHHVDASHDQACIDLEKASQFISEALQNEVQRNIALRMLIHRLEERASENGRSLSEQVESNRQLKLQVDKLQKHLEHKDNSLTQANQSVLFMSSPVDEADTPTQQTTSSSADIKAELVQEQDEESDMAPVLSSEINQSPPDPASLVKFLRLSVQVVDCCTIQHQQGTDGKNHEDGKEPKNVPSWGGMKICRQLACEQLVMVKCALVEIVLLVLRWHAEVEVLHQ